MASVFCSIFKYKQKAFLMKQIAKVDDIIVKKFNMKVDHIKVNNCIEKQFIYFLLFLLCFDILHICSTLNDGVTDFNYHTVQLFAILFIAYIQSFQIYMFMKAIVYRLNLIIEILEIQSDLNVIQHRIRNRIPHNLLHIKMLLIRIYEIIQLFNESFGLSMIGVIIEVYASVLVNIYWLHIGFLNVPFASIHGNKHIITQEQFHVMLLCFVTDVILFLGPTLITLISLAHCGFTIERLFQQIISSLTKLNEHQTIVNEIFLCILRKNFEVGPYDMFKINYSLVGIVSINKE